MNFVVIGVYLIATIAIGTLSTRRHKSANDYLNATRSLPTWMVTLSFLACNCGALEVVGLSGIALRYGVQAFHFYWIGAIPALIFVSFILLPLYVTSGIRSIPEFLERRFGRSVRLLNAWTLLVNTALIAGIALYGLAEVTHVLLGWHFFAAALCFALVAGVYVTVGGFRATVHNEILQLLMMVAGLTPLLLLTRHLIQDQAQIGQRWHLWAATPLISPTSSLDLLGVLIGLSLIVSFSYWCTDFILVQRALAARDLEAARRVPLLAGFGKLIFAFIVVAPVVAMSGRIAPTEGDVLNATEPAMMLALYGPAMISLGATALIASLLNALAANVSAFASIWTQEIYRSSLQRGKPERHYIAMGKIASGFCVGLAFLGAFLTPRFESTAEFALVIFSLITVPTFAMVLLGTLSRRGSASSAIGAALAGAAVGGLAHIAYALRWFPSGSPLNASFHAAIYSFAATIATGVLLGGLTAAPSAANMDGLLLDWGFLRRNRPSPVLWAMAAALLVVCIMLNMLWW